MAMVDGDWTITRSTGDIRYTGADHGVGTTISTTSFVTGTYYRIVVVGDTDFTLIGASANTVGVTFEATGVGGGTTGEALEVASYATVIEFHRWLQDFADDASSAGSDDELDITDDTPSDRSTDNIVTLLGVYNIDDTASEHLYDGSIIQGTGGSEVIYDGIVNFGNQEVMIQMLQSGVNITDDWWNYAESGSHTGAADASVLTDSDQTWVVDEWVGYHVLNTTDGSRGLVTENTATTITAVLGGGTEDDWDASDAYLIAKGLNSNAAGGISHRFMIKTRDAGADVDKRRLIGTNRRLGFTYGEFTIPATARGNNVLALSDSTDLNNGSTELDISGWTGITNSTVGYVLLDVAGDSVADEPFYSQWNTNQPTRSINDFYERMKWLTQDGNATTLYGIPGEEFRGITHQVAISGGAGTWVEPESLSWGTGATAGTGQLLAVDDTTASSSTKLWLQLLSGVVPNANTITGNGSATATAGEVTERAISSPFVGVSTGSALIGAYGLGVEADDLGASDLVFDLDNVGITPPNNVTFTVFGVVSNEDRVLVTNDLSSGIDFAQMTLNGSLTSGTVTSVVVQSAEIPADTPQTGNLRIEMDDGRYRLIPYTAHDSDDTFTVGSTSFTSDEAATTNNVFLGYIDELVPGASVAAGAFVTDVRYRITTIGTTDFTLIGASANTVGVIFTATGAGTGTGDADTVDVSASFTVVYNADRTLFVRVRDGDTTPIKTFETTGTLGSSGGSSTAIRTTDE